MKYTTSLWIGNIIIPYFTQKLNQLQNNLHQKKDYSNLNNPFFIS